MSVRRLSKAGGGVAVLDSSRLKREFALGDGGKGYASLVSRRALRGRAEVGEVKPYPPGLFRDCEMEIFRCEATSLGVPSLFVVVAGGFKGELTEPEKTYDVVLVAVFRVYEKSTHVFLFLGEAIET
jgi:hypothetical protein